MISNFKIRVVYLVTLLMFKNLNSNDLNKHLIDIIISIIYLSNHHVLHIKQHNNFCICKSLI